jgi:hypothetical protein
MKFRYRAVVVVAVILAPAGMRADNWPAPQTRNVFSRDGSHFVRIVPGSSWGDVEGFQGAATGEYARGLFYALEPDRSYRLVADVALVNPVAPVDALVTNRGDLVTFDNWHNFGFGAVIAIYDPAGALRASYTLEQLYGDEKLSDVPQSVSSRWWRCQPTGFVDPETETSLYVSEHLGGEFVLDLSPPSFTYHPGEAQCAPPSGPVSSTWFSE